MQRQEPASGIASNSFTMESNMSDVIKQYRITKQPYYRTVGDEVDLFEAAYSVRMPMMLTNP